MRAALPLSLLLLTTLAGSAQQARPGGNPAVVGYVYPAGGQAGTEIDVTVGGMALGGTRSAVFSGGGLGATILKHYKPINNVLRNRIRELLKAERENLAKARRGGTSAQSGNAPRPKRFIPDGELLATIAERENIAKDDIDAFLEEVAQRRDPKRQPNAQLAERLTLRVTIPPAAATGRRELRLLGGNGLSNPLVFMVGKLPETAEAEPNDTPAQCAAAPVRLPAVLNGRILPGDVDCFSFEARKGFKLTAAVAARELTPYLADAVPGWFQATLVLLGEDGREVAFNGSFDHRPDPLLCATIPADGRYSLEIRDSLCRGREDFVYRITAGEIPCLTEQFPLGGPLDTKVPIRVSGWNLADYQAVIEVGSVPGRRQIPPRPPILGFMQFEASPYPDFIEDDSDAASPNPWELSFPCTVNGIIRRPGERDRYSLRLKAGAAVVAEVRARRLGSPLDGNLSVIGPDRRTVAANDDCDDPASGLLTHHADPRVAFTAPADGIYQFAIADTQGKGSRGHAYRVTVAPPQPDFALRVTPSALNGRAGALVPFTVHLLRRDGFSGEVNLALADPPAGYALLGGRLAAGADSVQCTLKLSNDASPGVTPIRIEARATINGITVTRPAEPADDRMQAFFYRHLVPAAELLACVTGRSNIPGRGKPGLIALDRLRPLCAAGVKLPRGGSATLTIPRPQARAAPQNLIFSLSNPPPGVTLSPKVGEQRIDLVFSADAAKVKPGFLGNLIVEMSARVPSRNGKPQAKPQPLKLGTLPPIPCVVTEPQPR
jgi:hypothetical protein